MRGRNGRSQVQVLAPYECTDDQGIQFHATVGYYKSHGNLDFYFPKLIIDAIKQLILYIESHKHEQSVTTQFIQDASYPYHLHQGSCQSQNKGVGI